MTVMQTPIPSFATNRLRESVNTQFVRADYAGHAWLGHSRVSAIADACSPTGDHSAWLND